MNKQYLKNEEQKLLSKNTKFNIEREILSSLSKEELLEIIDMKAMALRTRKIFYGYRINDIKNSYRYKKANEITKYFLLMKEYYFWKWELINNEQKALNNLQMIIKVIYLLE